MTSHLSPSRSVTARSHPSWKLATAASSALVGLRSRRAGERWAAPRFTLRLFVLPLLSWQSGGPSWGCLRPACSLRGSGGWGWRTTRVAAGSERGSVPSCCRISMVTWAVPLPPGDTTFRTRVFSLWSRPVTPCPFAGIFPHWEVQSTL